MNKHYDLADFVKLVFLHAQKIHEEQSKRGQLEHEDLVKIFVNSEYPLAKSFAYVVGGMKGSQDTQYQTFVDKLKASEYARESDELKKRRSFPCIDVQECLFLLNESSDRNREKNYNYRNYEEFKNSQFVSGRATSFIIDWDILNLLRIKG